MAAEGGGGQGLSSQGGCKWMSSHGRGRSSIQVIAFKGQFQGGELQQRGGDKG